jgi:hypothetical protein
MKKLTVEVVAGNLDLLVEVDYEAGVPGRARSPSDPGYPPVMAQLDVLSAKTKIGGVNLYELLSHLDRLGWLEELCLYTLGAQESDDAD